MLRPYPQSYCKHVTVAGGEDRRRCDGFQAGPGTPLGSNGGGRFPNRAKCREEDAAREALRSLQVQGGTIFNIFV